MCFLRKTAHGRIAVSAKTGITGGDLRQPQPTSQVVAAHPDQETVIISKTSAPTGPEPVAKSRSAGPSQADVCEWAENGRNLVHHPPGCALRIRRDR